MKKIIKECLEGKSRSLVLLVFMGVCGSLFGGEKSRLDLWPSSSVNAEDIVVLEPIIVTAEMWNEFGLQSLLQTTVIDQQTLSDSRVLNVNDFDFLSPSLSHVDLGNPIESYPIIRGIGSTYNIGEFSVGLFTDGVYHWADHFYSQDQLDLERVDVIKGPQTTLFGKSTIGGAIHVVTQKPTMVPEFRSETILGERHLFHQQVIANIPDAKDGVAIRAAFQHKEFDGFYHNDYLAMARDDEALDHVRLKSLWEVNEKLEMIATVSYRILDAGSYAYHQVADDRDFVGESYDQNFPSRAEIGVFKASLHGRLVIGETMTVRSITSSSFVDQEDTADLDYTTTIASLANPAADVRFRRTNLRNDFFQDLRLNYDSGDRVQWLTGFSLSSLSDELDQRVSFDSPVSLPGPLPTLADREALTISSYGQLDWEVGERITLSPALRYDRENRYLTDRVALDNEGRSFDLVSPTVGLSFEISPRSLAYARFSSGARSGGLNVGGFQSFGRENFLNYEIGWNRQFMDKRAGIKSAVFWTDLNGRQANQFDTTSFTEYIVDQGSVRVFGAELESFVEVSEELRLSGSASFLNAKFREYSAIAVGPVGPGEFSFDGNRVPYVPDYELLFTANYRKVLGVEKSFFARADFRYTGKLFWDEFNLASRKSFPLVGFQAGVQFGPMKISGFIENVFDQAYFTNYVPTFRFPLSASALGVNGNPRFIGARLSLLF